MGLPAMSPISSTLNVLNKGGTRHVGDHRGQTTLSSGLYMAINGECTGY
jgi:hypothetical protein